MIGGGETYSGELNNVEWSIRHDMRLSQLGLGLAFRVPVPDIVLGFDHRGDRDDCASFDQLESSPARRVRSIDVLAERYARGEIDRDEFMRKSSDIAG